MKRNQISTALAALALSAAAASAAAQVGAGVGAGAGVDVNAGVNANANTKANANAKSGAATRAEANQLYDDLRREERNLRAGSRTQAKTTIQEDSLILSPARAGVSGSASSSTEGSVIRR